MATFGATSRGPARRKIFVLLAITLFSSYTAICAGTKKHEMVPVGLTGVHHLGSAYNIPEFYVNGHDGGNVGRDGGGASLACCVELPEKWRLGLYAEVRWSINDWSNENSSEIEAGNYSSIRPGGIYRATVPVEKYDEPGGLWVHFFPGGRVRVVSSNTGPEGPGHPISADDPHAADTATRGLPVDEIFTQQELAEIVRKLREERAKHGDWR